MHFSNAECFDVITDVPPRPPFCLEINKVSPDLSLSQFSHVKPYLCYGSLCGAVRLSFSSSFTLSYTHTNSAVSHHHHRTITQAHKKPVPLSHMHKHTPPQCCSVRTNKSGRVQGRMKQFGTSHTGLYQHEKKKHLRCGLF